MLLDETRAIELISRIARARNLEVIKGIGDDAAVCRGGLVVTTDAYLEGIHFDRSYLELSAVGARAMCGTLSDIAAMCATPTAVFVALLAPGTIDRHALRELYKGMSAIACRFHAQIAGGDIVASPVLGLALTALGRTRTPRFRNGARPGDSLYVTGKLGLAETGRIALKRNLDVRRYRPAIERHACPLPRITEARRLAPVISGLIDLSDGLSTDAGHIAEQSRVRIVLDPARFPTDSATRMLYPGDRQRMRFVLASGEDYELLFTSPRPDLPAHIGKTPVTRIGRVETGKGVWLQTAGRLLPVRPTGYDHFRKQRR